MDFNQVFELLVGVMNNKWVPWVLSLFIVMLGVSLFMWLKHVHVEPLLRHISDATHAVETTPRNDVFGKFEEISQHFEEEHAEPALAHSWSEFRETLVIDELGKQVQNTRPAEEFFNEASVILPTVDLRFYQAIPNILVGVGLFFTFLGLVAALYAANKGVGADDVQVAQNALRELLHAATFKFVTSIAGLGTSIMFSWREKVCVFKIGGRLHALCRALDERLVRIPAERLASDQLSELRTQSCQLKRFNTDLAVQISEALDRTLKSNMTEALKPVAEGIGHLETAINEMAGKMSSMNQDALSRMLDGFSSTVHDAAGKELSSLGAELRTLTDSMKNIQEGFVAASNSFSDQLGGSANGLVDALKGAEDGLLRAGEALQQRIVTSAGDLTAAVGLAGQGFAESGATFRKQMGGATAAFEESTAQFSDAVQRLDTLSQQIEARTTRGAETITESVRQVRAAAEGFERAADASRNAHQPVVEASQSLSAAGSRVQNATAILEKASTAVEALAGSLESTSAASRDIWDAYGGRFESLDENLAKIFGEISRGLEAYQAEVERFVGGLDASMGKSVKLLSGAVNEFGDRLEEFNVAAGAR